MSSARRLEVDAVVDTARRLHERVSFRFPERSISAVASELVALSEATKLRIESIARPQWLVRGAAIVVALAAITLLGFSTKLILATSTASSASSTSQPPTEIESPITAPDTTGRGDTNQSKGTDDRVKEVVEIAQAALQDLVFLGLGALFLFGLEGRVRRKKALAGLDELRSLAHVIDMHQLTKDPEAVLNPYLPTPSSPVRTTDRFELTRYLEYCSEMLALTNKLAAVYAQGCQDAIVLGGVRDIQDLVGMLSAKIWQKIVIVDTAAAVRPTDESPGTDPAGR